MMKIDKESVIMTLNVIGLICAAVVATLEEELKPKKEAGSARSRSRTDRK